MAIWRVRATLLTCILLGPLVGAALAATPAPARAASVSENGHVRIMIVSLQTLMEKAKAARKVRDQLNKKRAEYVKEISPRERALFAERDALQRDHDQGKYTQQTFNKKVREYYKKLDELRRNEQSKEQSLKESAKAAYAKIQDEIMRIVADVAKQRHVNLVLQQAAALTFDPKLNATEEVLAELDKKLPSVTVEFVKPTPEPAHAAHHKLPPSGPPHVRFK